MSSVMRFRDGDGLEIYIQFESDVQETESWVKELIEEDEFELVDSDDDHWAH